jgi:hypothetical protein
MNQMTDVVLVLGPIVFQDFEIPSGINFGGRQLLAVHQLTDGQRVVDSIGPDESEISFSGTFSGADATSRSRLLNFLRATGGELNLTWDVFFYTVVVSHFDANYENPVWIPYRISCTVVRDEAVSAVSSVISLANSILADLGVAAGQCASLGLEFTDVQSSLANPGATTLGSAAYLAAQSGVSLAQSAITTQIGSTEATLQAAISSSPSSAGSLIANLMTSTTAAQKLANFISARAYVGRAARNLSIAST